MPVLVPLTKAVGEFVVLFTLELTEELRTLALSKSK